MVYMDYEPLTKGQREGMYCFANISQPSYMQLCHITVSDTLMSHALLEKENKLHSATAQQWALIGYCYLDKLTVFWVSWAVLLIKPFKSTLFWMLWTNPGTPHNEAYLWKIQGNAQNDGWCLQSNGNSCIHRNPSWELCALLLKSSYCHTSRTQAV